MIAKDDINILCCPFTHEPMQSVGAEQLATLNAAVAKGELKHVTGNAVMEKFEAAITNTSQSFVYPIREGVILLFRSFAIPSSASQGTDDFNFRNEKEIVRSFYDEIGWHQNKKGEYKDTILFVDQRPVSREYLEKCHLRLSGYLPNSGRYFLDAGSGPITHDVYLTYSQNFAKRICIDISFLALQKARQKLGDRGIYILGDLTNLPLLDHTIDAAVSLHAIYHIPADEQRKAFDELHRIIKDDGIAVVVYTFGKHSPLVKAAGFPFRVAKPVTRPIRKIMQAIAKPSQKTDSPAKTSLYFHPHPYSWFRRQQWNYPLNIYCWRSIGRVTLKQWFHSIMLGKQLLRALFALEAKLPKLMGRLGQYPLIVIRKAIRGASTK